MKAWFEALRLRLVNNAREVWKHWSLRLGAIGSALAGWFITSPETAIQAWAMIPTDVKQYLPPQFVGYAGMTLLALGLLAKFIKQSKLPSNQ